MTHTKYIVKEFYFVDLSGNMKDTEDEKHGKKFGDIIAMFGSFFSILQTSTPNLQYFF